jgi:pyruvate dehydrogenase E1 component alpha subunit
MIFTKYDPDKDKMYQVLDSNGKIILKDWKLSLSKSELIEVYKKMLLSREADLKAVSYQRQGRMYTYPPNLGQEAISLAAGVLMEEDDWLVPAFRELSAYLAKGVSLKEFYLYFRGHEDASLFAEAKNILPISVPIASQLLHAVGIGYAMKLKKQKNAVFAFVGDGGTSEGDFHEALNFAGVWQVPVLFIVQNNQFAISVPFVKQTASANIAMKANAYGIKGIKVDGNDFLAMYDVIKEAAVEARQKHTPILIEALTYRMGAHTTSDDPTKYRTDAEEKEWLAKDPVKRLRSFLTAKKWWTRKQEEQLLEDYRKEIDRQFEAAENYPDYKLEDVFAYHYEEIPEDLKRQQTAYQKYLNWKEARK